MATLSIKNEEACRLIRELAELTGKSMTAVVIEAVQEKLDRERKPGINEDRMRYFLELGQRVRKEANPDWIARDQIADLCDEYGLPK